jgi:hypothetical protein
MRKSLQPLRVLVGHDGSSYADAAIVDLQRAGLPEPVEALVMTVGDAPLVAPLCSGAPPGLNR